MKSGPRRGGEEKNPQNSAEAGQTLDGEPVSFIKDRQKSQGECTASLWVWSQKVGSHPVCVCFHRKAG